MPWMGEALAVLGRRFVSPTTATTQRPRVAVDAIADNDVAVRFPIGFMRAPAKAPAPSTRYFETMLVPMSFNTRDLNDKWLPPAKLMHASMRFHYATNQPNYKTVLTTPCGSCTNDATPLLETKTICGTMVSKYVWYHGLKTCLVP